MLKRVCTGEATPMDLDIISSVQDNIMGHCLCVLGDAMAMPVSSMVNKFRDEFEETIAREAARAWETSFDGESSPGRDVNANEDEPGPGGVSPEEIRRERLAGRSIPSGSGA